MAICVRANADEAPGMAPSGQYSHTLRSSEKLIRAVVRGGWVTDHGRVVGAGGVSNTVGKFLSAPESIFKAGAAVSALTSGGIELGEMAGSGATLSGGAFRCAGGPGVAASLLLSGACALTNAIPATNATAISNDFIMRALCGSRPAKCDCSSKCRAEILIGHASTGGKMD